MYQLVFYVPRDHCEQVKRALFEVGAGRYHGYDSCSWQSEGVGQFRPMEGSSPFIGSIGKLERVVETRVEMVCEDSVLSAAIEALREAHPYEEPAFSFFSINGDIH